MLQKTTSNSNDLYLQVLSHEWILLSYFLDTGHTNATSTKYQAQNSVLNFKVTQQSPKIQQNSLSHSKWHLASTSEHPEWNAKSAPQTAHDNDHKPTPSSEHDFHKPTPCNTHKQTSWQWAQVPQTNKQRTRRRRRRRQQRLRSRRRKRSCTYVTWLHVTVAKKLYREAEEPVLTIAKKKKPRRRSQE